MENAEIKTSQFADLGLASQINADEVELIGQLRREGREAAATNFRREYSYGTGMEGKTCIWPGGVYSWSEKSSGIMWVGVHGNNSICVVTKAGDLDVTRVHNSLIFHTKETVLQHFRRAVISEIEDLADPSSKLHKMLDQRFKTPFGVVSVIPGTGKVYKERVCVYETYGYKEDRLWTLRLRELNIGQTSSEWPESDERDEYFKELLEEEKIRLQESTFRIPPPPGYDKTKTIMFLQKEMKTGATCTTNEASNDDYDEKKVILYLLQKIKIMKRVDFTVDETTRIAISAFQHLFKKEFNADDIEVSVMDPDYFVPAAEANYKDIYLKHLETSDIKHHLAVINKPGSNGSDSPPKKRSKGSSSGTFERID